MSKWKKWNTNRWFVLAAGFLVLNAWGLWRIEQHLAQPMKETAVDQFLPGSKRPVQDKASLTWVFTSPMVRAGQTGEELEEGPFRLEPETPGRWIWDTRQTLRFTPAQAWPVCQSFEAILKEGMTDLDRHPLLPPHRYAFRSETLQVRSVDQVHIEADRRVTLRLSFSGALSPEELRQHLELKESGSKVVSFSVTSAHPGRQLIVRAGPVNRDKLLLVIRKGLHSTEGPLGLEQDYRTEVSITQALQLTRLRAESSAFEDGTIDAYFSSSVDLNQARDYIRVEPEVPFSVTRAEYWRDSAIRLKGAFQPAKSYTVTFKQGLPSTTQTALLEDLRRNVYFKDRPKALAFRNPGTYLSSRGSRRITLTSVNTGEVTLRTRRVYPNNIVPFAMRQAGRYPGYYSGNSTDTGLSQGLKKVDVPIAAVANQAVETQVDMKALTGEHASGVFLVQASAKDTSSDDQLVVITDIGLTVKQASDGLLVWANSLLTLEALAQAEVVVYSDTNQELFRGTTDAAGLVFFAYDNRKVEDTPFVITAQKGDDLSYLKLHDTRVNAPGDIGGDAYTGDHYDACLFTDRGIYRPGEPVHLVAAVRDAGLQCPAPFPVELKIRRPDGKIYRTLNGTLSANATAEFEWTWEAYAGTGRYTCTLHIPGNEEALGYAAISVEEYLPPQIAVSIPAADGRGQGGAPYTFDVKARYLFGAPAGLLPVSGRVEYLPVNFEHPDWPGFIFHDAEKKFSREFKKLGTGKLDETGTGRFGDTVPAGWRPPSAIKAMLGATVTESSGRAASSYSSRMIDIYPYYIGLRPGSGQGTVPLGAPQVIHLAAVQQDGQPNPEQGTLRVRRARITYATLLKKDSQGRYHYESERRVDFLEPEMVALTAGRAEYRFTPQESGQFLVMVDDPERGVSASWPYYAASPENRWHAWSMEKPDVAEVVADREEYAPGDTAKLLIKAPFPGKALVTLESDRILEQRIVSMDTNTHEVEFNLTEAHLPNVYCRVSIIRPVVAGERHTGHRAAGVCALRVTRPERRLQVAVETPDTLRPNSLLTAKIRVTNAAGSGVPVAVVVAAVDEGICMLTDFQTPDPLKYFERKRRLGVDQYDLYSLLLPELKLEVLGAPSVTGGGGASINLGRRLNPIKARRFRSVALWSSEVRTDTNGFARVALAVPEFTGELRFMAVALGRDQFGSVEAPVKVKRPLILQTSLPRFMAPGDACEAPVSLFNETDADMKVRLSVQCEGPLRVKRDSWQETVPAGKERRTTIPVTAGQRAGKAVFTVSVTAENETFSDRIELAVRPPSPRITRSGFGSVKAGETRTVGVPAGWLEGTAEHRLAVSGLPTLNLGDRLDYLLRYPYGCLEQTTSSAFPLIYLQELAERIRPGSMGKEETAHFIQSGIFRILSMQYSSGGFGYWPNRTTPYPWGSIYATHFLAEAQRAGHTVPKESLDLALDQLEELLSRSVSHEETPGDSTWREDMNRRSYACYVLALAERPQSGWMNRLQEQVEMLDVISRIQTAAALAVAGQRPEAARMLELLTPDRMPHIERETDGALNSSVRNLAILLNAWLEIDPQHEAVPLLVRSLDEQRQQGHWYTTQENAVALMALGRYAGFMNRHSQAFTAEVSWPGAPDRTVSSTEPAAFDLPFADGGNVTLHNQGPGLLYFYQQSSGVSVAGEVEELDRQLKVRRRFWNLDGSEVDIRTCRAGELRVVQVELDPLGRSMQNIVVEDLLPAGLEVENARLKTSQLVPWLQDKITLNPVQLEIRDDRVVLFTPSFSGKVSYYYAVRAVTPGRYVYPAILAECMYDPSIRSVHGKTAVGVEE